MPAAPSKGRDCRADGCRQGRKHSAKLLFDAHRDVGNISDLYGGKKNVSKEAGGILLLEPESLQACLCVSFFWLMFFDICCMVKSGIAAESLDDSVL